MKIASHSLAYSAFSQLCWHSCLNPQISTVFLQSILPFYEIYHITIRSICSLARITRHRTWRLLKTLSFRNSLRISNTFDFFFQVFLYLSSFLLSYLCRNTVTESFSALDYNGLFYFDCCLTLYYIYDTMTVLVYGVWNRTVYVGRSSSSPSPVPSLTLIRAVDQKILRNLGSRRQSFSFVVTSRALKTIEAQLANTNMLVRLALS